MWFLLMKKFYAEHRNENLAPSLALARAQRWLRDLSDDDAKTELGFVPQTVGSEPHRPFSNPYYWAAFTLTGL